MKQLISTLVIVTLISTCVTASPGSLLASSSRNAIHHIEPELTITPNIKTGAAKVSFKAGKAAAGTLLVIDQSGKVVLRQATAVQAGINTILVQNFTSLSEGSYNVLVKAGRATYKSTYLLWK